MKIIKNVKIKSCNFSLDLLIPICICILLFLQLQGRVLANYDDQNSDNSSEIINDTDEVLSEIRNLRGQIEILEHKNKQLNEKLELFKKDVDFRLHGLEVANAAAASSKSSPERESKGDTTKKSGKDASLDTETKSSSEINSKGGGSSTIKDTKEVEDEYNNAYTLLKAGKSNNDHTIIIKARDAFQLFIKKHPSSQLVASAYFWIGQIYTDSKEYDDAQISYFKGYNANKNGPRAQDNLLYLTYTFFDNKKQKEGCATLEKLKTDFQGKLKPNISEQVKKLDSAKKCYVTNKEDSKEVNKKVNKESQKSNNIPSNNKTK